MRRSEVGVHLPFMISRSTMTGGSWPPPISMYESAVEGDSIIGYSSGGYTNPERLSLPQKADKVLKITKVDYLVAQNTKAHNTDEYSLANQAEFGEPELIVRRGQPFDVEVTLNRACDKNADDLRLLFEIGQNPLPSKGTRVDILLSDVDVPKEWGSKVKSYHGNKIIITIFTPPNCFVGKWAFSLDTKLKGEDTTFRYRNQRPIYILFNPWCQDDMVYMKDESDRDEYVMNDTGKIYIGSKKNIRGRPWNFAQFDDYVLECAIGLLDKSDLGWTARGDAVKIVRKLTSLCNSPDNTGVLWGNWSGDYAGGSSPLKWTGSQNILRNYHFTGQPVKFGQCWVFSGVLTSVCRTLGIPARSITNFASAHDADNSITIDTYYDVDGNDMDVLNVDSVWNFHVWNEAWMARPDLPPGYGGWQVIDATPQETSEGVFCCGPASLVAVKKGEVNWPYDGAFVFAEVNADRVRWQKKKDGTWAKMLQKNSVGKSISTKKKGDAMTERWSFRQGDPDREDVTLCYKYPEGSDAERAAVLNAQKCNTSSVTFGAGSAYATGPEDVNFELADLEEIPFGSPFKVKVKVTNTSAEKRTVKVTLTASAISYTGCDREMITTSKSDVVLNPGQGEVVALDVTFDDYRDECIDHAMIRMSCSALVVETNQVHIDSDDFDLTKPTLDITCPKQVRVGDSAKVSFGFTNPTDMVLTQCTLEVTGPGLQVDNIFKTPNVPAHGKFSYNITLTPQKPGRNGKQRQIIAKFSSKQIADIDGVKNITVVAQK